MTEVERYDDEISNRICNELRESGMAENALIYLAMQDTSFYHEAGASCEWFSTPTTKKLYRTIGEMISEGLPVDVVTVAERLMKLEPNVHWMAVTTDTWRNAPGVKDSVKYYTEIIKSAYTRRRSREIADRLMRDAQSDGAIDTAIRDLMDLGTSSEARYEHDMGETMRATVAHIEESYNKAQEGGTVGITTGLLDLDDAIGGWHPTDLYVIAGRPGVSKTGSLLNMLLNSGVRFGIDSTEQPFVQVGMRLISMQGMVNSGRLRRGKLQNEDWLKIQAAVNALKDRQFWINDCASMDINELTRQARKWRYTNQIEILGVDYIQRLKGTHPRMPEREKVMEVTRGLKTLAKELEIPVIALAQVNRACEARPDKRPQMGDIAESSIIEMEADGVCCLYRDEVYNPDTPDKGILEWLWHKNRHGPTGVVRTQWQGEFFKVNNFATQYYQDY